MKNAHDCRLGLNSRGFEAVGAITGAATDHSAAPSTMISGPLRSLTGSWSDEGATTDGWRRHINRAHEVITSSPLPPDARFFVSTAAATTDGRRSTMADSTSVFRSQFAAITCQYVRAALLHRSHAIAPHSGRAQSLLIRQQYRP